MGNGSTWLGEIPPWARWDLSEGDENFPYESKFGEPVRLIGMNVLCGVFWLAKMQSFQYFRAPSQGNEMNVFPYETNELACNACD